MKPAKRKPKKSNRPKPGRCEHCGKEFPGEDLIHGPDPFASEVNGDDTPTVLCKECYRQSVWDT